MSRPPIKLPAADSELARLVESICEGTISPAGRDRLESLLADDRDAKLFYVAYLDLHAQMQWLTRGEGQGTKSEGREARDEGRGMVGSPTDVSIGAAVVLPHQPGAETPGPEPIVPPIVLDLSPTSHYPLSTSHSFVGGPVFSYMVATVILGMMLLGAWAYKITHYNQIAENRSQETLATDRPEMVFIGRITGMKDCRWSDPQTEAYAGASVPLGRKYALASGLMEITYITGAKVILQGPCTYQVESRTGGYLALGKLTARIEGRREKREEGAKPPAANQKSPNLQIPKFAVRTPTAVVTDLGTEFGVEVSEEGNTTSHVFRGSVKVRVVGESLPSPAGRGAGDEGSHTIILGENESARVEAGAARGVTVMRRPAVEGAFVREIPRRERIKVFNTGIGAKEGEPDPHWELAAFFQSAINNDPKSRPAVVTSVTQQFRPNDAERSQWISKVGDLSSVRGGRYTFRAAFDLPVDAIPETAALLVRFIADNYVEAVRFNGRIVPLSETGYDPSHNQFDRFHSFSIRKGFVAGNNVLEFDVFNYHANSGTPMALLVELEGYVVRGWRGEKKGTGPISPDGPEGAAHKLAPSPSSHPDAGKEGNP